MRFKGKDKEYVEDLFWALIKAIDWKNNSDYKRVKGKLNGLDKEALKDFEDFCIQKSNDLYTKFKDAWLGEPGIEVSDDGWSDLRAEVVGRGKRFYENITAKKLRKMARDGDYKENFLYIFF